MKSITVAVTLTFEVEWDETDFEDGEFPPDEELKAGAIEYVLDEYLSKRGRAMLEPLLTANPVIPVVKIVT